MVEAAEIIPIVLSKQAKKTVKIAKEEEVGRALPIRSIRRVNYNEQRNRGQDRIGEVKEEEIVDFWLE